MNTGTTKTEMDIPINTSMQTNNIPQNKTGAYVEQVTIMKMGTHMDIPMNI